MSEQNVTPRARTKREQSVYERLGGTGEDNALPRTWLPLELQKTADRMAAEGLIGKGHDPYVSFYLLAGGTKLTPRRPLRLLT